MKIDPIILILAFRSFGVRFEKYDVDPNVFCISVPETSEYCDSVGRMLNGFVLSRKLKEIFKDHGVQIDVAYRVRKEHWTKSMGQASIAKSLENMDADTVMRILQFGESFENFDGELEL